MPDKPCTSCNGSGKGETITGTTVSLDALNNFRDYVEGRLTREEYTKTTGNVTRREFSVQGDCPDCQGTGEESGEAK